MIISRLKNNTVIRNIFLMSSMTILAQLINVLVQPILTRIVPPEILGEYTYLISLANIIIPVASLKLDMLIVSEKDNRIAQYLTDTCIIVCALLSLIYLLVILVGYVSCADVFYSHGVAIFIVPLVVFANGIRFIFISYNNRYRQYKIIGIVGVIRESARAVIQIISGLLCLGVFGQIIGYALAPIFGFRTQNKEYVRRFKHRKLIRKEQFLHLIKYCKEQIFYLVPSQFINSFANSLIIIFISYLYTAEQLGYYSAGTRLLEIPMIFIAANVSKVCYKQISEDVALGKHTSRTFLGISFIMAMVSLIGFGFLYMIAPPFAKFIFGEGYEIAGIYIRCFCLMYAVRLTSTSFAGLFTVFGYQKYELCLNIFLIVFASVAFLYAKTAEISMESFLVLISIVYTIMYILMWGAYFILCRKHDNNL